MRFITVVITLLILLLAIMPALAARLEIKAEGCPDPEASGRISAPRDSGGTAGVGSGDTAPEESAGELITLFRTESGEHIELDMDEYLTGVVAAEMYSSYEPEALKAQAVAARSYCEYRRSRASLSSHPEAVVCDDSAHCEAYISLDGLRERSGVEYAEAAWAKISAAVREVSGIILTCEGRPANALYHASSHLTTESADAIWEDAPPYLVSVSTPEEAPSEVTAFDPESFSRLLAKAGIAVYGEPDGWISAITRTRSGRAGSISICGGELSGTDARSLFGLRSCDFELYYLDGSFCFITHGYGHGLGMSQSGAQVMALSGADWREILAHYYPGTEIAERA